MINPDLMTSIPEQVTTTFLGMNYPNPFTAQTTIPVSVTRQDEILLEVFDIHGLKVKTLASRVYQPGTYFFSWDGTDNKGNRKMSGVYFYRLTTDEKVQTKKMILIH